jgi:hypothetical protein
VFNRLNAAFADGKVRVVEGSDDPRHRGEDWAPAAFDEKLLRALITRSGGDAARIVKLADGVEIAVAQRSQTFEGPGVITGTAPASPGLNPGVPSNFVPQSTGGGRQ